MPASKATPPPRHRSSVLPIVWALHAPAAWPTAYHAVVLKRRSTAHTLGSPPFFIASNVGLRTRTDFFTRPIFRALHATHMLVRIQPGPLLWPCSQTEKAPPFEGGDLIAHGSATRACETLSTAWNSRGLSSDLAFAPARGWANFRWSARSTDFVHPSVRAPHATLHGSPVRIRPPLRRM